MRWSTKYAKLVVGAQSVLRCAERADGTATLVFLVGDVPKIMAFRQHFWPSILQFGTSEIIKQNISALQPNDPVFPHNGPRRLESLRRARQRVWLEGVDHTCAHTHSHTKTLHRIANKYSAKCYSLCGADTLLSTHHLCATSDAVVAVVASE